MRVRVNIHWSRSIKNSASGFALMAYCRKCKRIPKRLPSDIISRLKIMDWFDEHREKRLPQDGRIQVKIKKKPIDLRVSTIPTNHGESVVMRVCGWLDKSSLKLVYRSLDFFRTIRKFSSA